MRREKFRECVASRPAEARVLCRRVDLRALPGYGLKRLVQSGEDASFCDERGDTVPLHIRNVWTGGVLRGETLSAGDVGSRINVSGLSVERFECS